ncbi:hypothetical protein CC78DRAFT_554172 [Lojkania enalia]|uniref:NAD(P)-binding protein n=1 Tax=Lojkania enalia TaxID=147567 RepID=A0A9P4K5X2_9PLEO|nr:hypothetical protein CC78DRAFT_554172 [Didymosphaeria enalia]
MPTAVLTDYKVIAVHINIDDPIKQLRCQTEQLNLSWSDSIQSFAQKIGDHPIDLLLNVTGRTNSRDNLEEANFESLKRSPHPRVAVTCSCIGPIADNSSSSAYAYCGSKAAVDALFKSLTADLKETKVLIVLLHPGIVHTNSMKGQNVDGSVEPEQAASELWKVLMNKGVKKLQW